MSVLVLLAAAAAATLAVQAAFGPAQLDFANRSIDSLDNVTLTAYIVPNILDLSRNHITELPEDAAILNLTSLRVLDLSHNSIQVIYGSPFRTLRALRVLNLSGNAIDTIAVNGFCGPDALQSLDLSNNNLTELVDRVFVPLVSLQHLNLSGNRLRSLTEGCFNSLQRLQQLDLSWNQLRHVAPGTLQALPSLARLLLAGNSALGTGAREAALLVGTGRRLQTVDASRTGLQHVPATLTHSVRTLRLAGNSIHSVRCGDLDSYPLLQLLDLTTNALEEIEDDALGRLEMLAVLYLTDNKLQAIPRSLPDRLEILHLEFNNIEQIVSGDLLGLPKLEVLLLNDNTIKVVQEGAFSQVTSLVTLDLSRNPISILPADTLAGPARLQMLRLAGLAIQPPAEDMAFPVPTPEHLVRLDLSGSPGLARQLLADTAALAAFRDLQELNLANTDLTNVRSDLLHYLPQMHDFHLTGNQLNCTGLLWLALWMRRQDQPEYRQVACASPPELYGILLVDLQDTFLPEVVFTTLTTTTATITTEDYIMIKQMQTESVFGEETTIYMNEKNDVTLKKNVTFEESLEQLGVSKKEMTDTTMMSMTTGDEHRSSLVASVFPTAAESATEFSTDRTETVPSVTDGHIGEITPSDNHVATEAANYSSSALSGELEPELSMENVTYAAAAAAAVSGSGGGTRTPVAVLALLVAVLGAGATLLLHTRRRRQRRYARQHDIEADSLANVHELW